MLEIIEARRNKVYNMLEKEKSKMKTKEDMLSLIKKCDEFVMEYPYDNRGYRMRAFILEFLGLYELALNDLQRENYLKNNPMAHVMKGMILLKLGKYENGYVSYEWRRGLTFKNNNFVEVGKNLGLPYWNGEKISKDEKLFVLFEQGFGDMIQFYRFIPYLRERGINIVIAYRDPIIDKLFRKSLEKLGVEVCNVGDKIKKEWKYYIFAMSLPHVLKIYDENDIPYKDKYLDVSDEFLDKWKNKLEFLNHSDTNSSNKTSFGVKNRKRIGIFWESEAPHEKSAFRNISFKKIKNLFNLDVEFHCLQKKLINDEKIGGGYENLYFWDDELNDFCDTAALISQMDLVITVDTAVAHLAGAMGKPTWILLSYISDFRWLLNRDDSPWYDSVRLFRQKEDYDWDSVIFEVKKELRKFIK